MIAIRLVILGFVLIQATVGPCNVPKPRAWNPVEQSKWTRLVPLETALELHVATETVPILLMCSFFFTHDEKVKPQ